MDTRITTRAIAASIFAAIAALGLTGVASAAEFSAVQNVTTKGVNGTYFSPFKLFVKGKLERYEGFGTITIVRPDKGVEWVLSPAKKTCTEITGPLSKANQADAEALNKAPGIKKVGTSKIAGYVCDKYTFSLGGSVSATRYFSPQLKYDLRTESPFMGRKTVSELSKIRVGKQASSLFEIPSGYKKTRMRAAAGPGPGGMPGMPGMQGGKAKPGAGRNP